MKVAERKILLDRLVKLNLVQKEGSRYYSKCVWNEEITTELKELFK